MSMIQAQPVVYADGIRPGALHLKRARRLRDSGVSAGMGEFDAQGNWIAPSWDELAVTQASIDVPSPVGYELPTPSGGGGAQAVATQPSWWEKLLGIGVSTASQVALNKNQAKIYTTGPGGTVAYQPNYPTSMYGTAAVGAGAMTATTMLLIGGGLLALVLVMNKR